MKTWSDVKNRLKVGTTLTQTKHSGANPVLVGVARKIKYRQTNAIQFEPHQAGKSGSWLYFPKASQVTIVDDNTFAIDLGWVQIEYKFEETPNA